MVTSMSQPRAFVVSEAYVGPDRRRRDAPRSAGRRASDRVKAVAAWHGPTTAYGSGFVPTAPDPADFEQVAGDMLAEALAAVAAEGHDVPVEAVVREGEAAHVLLEESEGAAQLVVGCRNLGSLSRLFHHSVSGHCTHDAHCPVTVVHEG